MRLAAGHAVEEPGSQTPEDEQDDVGRVQWHVPNNTAVMGPQRTDSVPCPTT